MTFFLGTYSIYTNGFQIPHLKKKKNRVSFGFARVTRVPGRPVGSPGFGRAVATAGLLLNPDRSSHRVDPPGRAEFNNSAHNTVHSLQFYCRCIYIFSIFFFLRDFILFGSNSKTIELNLLTNNKIKR
jgi:hypothetical protein